VSPTAGSVSTENSAPRGATSSAQPPPRRHSVRTARQGAQTWPAASPRHHTALSHAWNVPTEALASVARATGHILTGAADGVGSAQPGFYGDCCAPAYRAAGATAFYRALSP
jgi:hypothetical protein